MSALAEKAKVKASRTLSLALRHHPEAIGVVLDAGGWAQTRDVLAGLSEHKGITLSRTQLDDLVATNDKQRFALSSDGRRIRANQGHSLDVELDLKPERPPGVLYHGTDSRSHGLILRDGLLKMKRAHVHLSADTETAFRVGARRRGEVLIFAVNAETMYQNAHRFYRSANGVWLTDHVPPHYLSYAQAPA